MLNLGLLLIQLIVVLTAARLAGRLVRLFGQPVVIGEMIAGLALGPSLLGAIAPNALAALFPADGLLPLATLSQIGVLLYLFVVGLRLDLDQLRGKARAAVAVSNTSVALPFLLGLAIAPLLHPTLAPEGVTLLPFSLFLGAAMSVTAFPVLARILTEQRLLQTRVGVVAIAAAAVDDVTAWGILAAVVAVARVTQSGANANGAVMPFVISVGGTALYAILLVTVGRRVLARVLSRFTGDPTPAQVSLAVLLALASAAVTEYLGVHAFFGAFIAGAVVPRATGANRDTDLAGRIADRIEDVVCAVLLPLFFAFTGLRTAIGLVSGGEAWAFCGLILLVAVSGKLLGSALAARIAGMTWRDAVSVGVLMNTRGLMELVILNVGLDVGVISPPLFAMMVLMALVTTVMTSPLIAVLQPQR